MSEQIDWSKAPEGATVLLKHVRDGAYAVSESYDDEAKTWHWPYPRYSFNLMPSMWRIVAERPITPSWSGEVVDPDNLELKMLADKYLSYSTETGALTWKDNQQKRFIGREAGYVTHHGYRRINLGKVKIHAHQLIWLMVNGFLPSCEIDHINGNRDDNRIENLRMATTQQNQQNAGVRVDNALGIKGVRLRPSGRYQARVSLTDGSRLTKTFKTHVEAVCWLAKQREESHGDFANTPEQVAADEREAYIRRMQNGAESLGFDEYEICATLYDKGLRFQD